MKFLLPISLLILLTAASWRLGKVEIGMFEVREENGDFVTTWTTTLEEDVREFEVVRRSPSSPNDTFVPVKDPLKPRADRTYSVRDTQVFKSGQEKLDYRLEVVYNNGVREVLRTQSVNYTTTVVRRTWGSLKAMFQ